MYFYFQWLTQKFNAFSVSNQTNVVVRFPLDFENHLTHLSKNRKNIEWNNFLTRLIFSSLIANFCSSSTWSCFFFYFTNFQVSSCCTSSCCMNTTLFKDDFYNMRRHTQLEMIYSFSFFLFYFWTTPEDWLLVAAVVPLQLLLLRAVPSLNLSKYTRRR